MRSAILIALGGLSTALAVPVEKRADYAIKNKHFVPEEWRMLGKSRPV